MDEDAFVAPSNDIVLTWKTGIRTRWSGYREVLSCCAQLNTVKGILSGDYCDYGGARNAPEALLQVWRILPLTLSPGS